MAEEPGRYEEITANLLKYSAQIRGYVYSLVHSAHDVEDIMQEMAMAMWKMRERYEPGSNFLAWAKAIAYRRTCEFFRSRRGSLPMDERLMRTLADESLDEDASEGLVDHREALRECLGRMHERNRSILMSYYEQDSAYESIARRLNRSTGAIHVLFHRLRKELRKCVERRLCVGREVRS